MVHFSELRFTTTYSDLVPVLNLIAQSEIPEDTIKLVLLIKTSLAKILSSKVSI